MDMPARELTNLLTPLYSNVLNLKEDLGELKETIKNKTKSFVRYGGPEDIGPMRRVVSAAMCSGFLYSANNLYFYTPIHLPSSILRLVMLPLLVYGGLEFLGAAVTGRFNPIKTYVREKF